MTKKRFTGTAAFASLMFLSLATISLSGAEQALKLWYTKPADKWTDALPIGNGTLGAMVFGGVTDERIQFNEDTLWRGKPHDYVRAGAGDALPEIRQLLFEDKGEEAQKLVRAKFLSDPVRQLPYQPFGDLRLHFPGHNNVTDYRRELDLDSALASVSYRIGDVTFVRSAFASYPDRAIVLMITATKPGQISFTLKMDSPHTNSHTRAVAADAIGSVAASGTLALTGRVQDDGLRFESRVQVFAFGGNISTNGDAVTVEKADSAKVILVAATSFKNFQDISADPARRCAKDLAKFSDGKLHSVLTNHLADHRALFRRVNLNLGVTDAAKLPTDQRLKQMKTARLESDPALAALYFQYGRYLLIASSRPGSQPANLQGVWNEELNPPWESKYTLNINCEMNYWPAELCNLTECHEPLFDMIDDLAISGARTAKKQYASRGWVVHHNTDLWRGSAPINNVDGVWPTGGAWLCHHLWEHYLFTGDKTFLANRAYPAMKQASVFFVDFLIKDPETGYLITNPSHSPEQSPPSHTTLTYGPTMDNQLIRALLTYTIQASEILGVDREFAKQLADVRSQLAPNTVGKHGQLQEWLKDWDKPNNNHRHMSPLFALYPGWEITPANPTIYDAAKVLLKWRGPGSTGWSFAWRIPLWARVGDGEYAFTQLDSLLDRRTLPNLFDLCGPFQIDGNFGACAGVAEMLIQSHQTTGNDQNPGIRIIDLLPALPKAWPTGSVSGLCSRGGFEVEMEWKDGSLKKIILLSKLGNPCKIRYGKHSTELGTKKGERYAFDENLHPLL